jgi:hypothetical protein
MSYDKPITAVRVPAGKRQPSVGSAWKAASLGGLTSSTIQARKTAARAFPWLLVQPLRQVPEFKYKYLKDIKIK